MDKNLALFSSADIHLAAALSALNLRPDRTEFTNGRMTFFWSQSEAKDLSVQYYAKRLQVDARSFADEMRQIKTVVHQAVVLDESRK